MQKFILVDHFVENKCNLSYKNSFFINKIEKYYSTISQG